MFFGVFTRLSECLNRVLSIGRSDDMDHTSLLRAGRNPQRLIAELSDLLGASAIENLHAALEQNVHDLLHLADHHLEFGEQVKGAWRQKVSRLYYGAYHTARAVHLHRDGHYSQNVGDHAKVSELPDDFPQSERYNSQLGTLREDRNLADYDQSASKDQLVLSPDEAESLVTEFAADARDYLRDRGIVL